MTEYQKLVQTLCEVKETKEDIMELKFWTDILFWTGFREAKLIDIIQTNAWDTLMFLDENSKIKYLAESWKNYKIIWNPLELRHLMWYLWINEDNVDKIIDEKLISYSSCFDESWRLTILSYNVDTSKVDIIAVKLDNTKPLHQQEENVFKQINEFLEQFKTPMSWKEFIELKTKKRVW